MSTSTQHHTLRRARAATTALALLGALLLQVAVTPAASALGGGTVSAALSTAGFPLWYEDESGVRLAPCVEVADPNCNVLPTPGFDPGVPLAFPGNFPEEFFYSVADSDVLDTPGCAGLPPGKVSLHNALEGAFANGPQVDGDQMVFGRSRLILTGGLCPTSTYTVVGPYGTFDVTTDTDGAIKRAAATTDIGCLPVAPAACDFRVPLGSPQASSFLRWDPDVLPLAPARHLGDGATAHAITGATYIPDGAVTPANYVEITGPGLAEPLRTDQFVVLGRLAGPLWASPGDVAFAGQDVGTTSATRRVTVTNLDGADLTLAAAVLDGADAADFAIVADGCAGDVLARDASCTVDISFTPSVQGDRAAGLTVGHDGTGGALAVALSGTGTVPPQVPALTLSETSVDLGSVRLVNRSAPHTVRVTNSGTAPLVINRVETNGSAASEYIATSRCLAPVAPGSSCAVEVVFDPATLGTRTAELRISSNAASSPDTVSLTGTGIGGVTAVSAERNPVNGFPRWYQDERGVRVVQCIDQNDPNCIVLPGGTFTGGSEPLVFPTRYPDEFFYSVVDSDLLSTPGCDGSDPGKMLVRFGLEAAFINGDPVPGEQMTFGRVRIRASGGLCPDTTYTVIHPYGTDQVTTDASGALKPAANTSDVGCAPLSAAEPCDFGIALQSPVLGGLLRWDPTVAPAAPAGYLGDGISLHKVTGSPYRVPGADGPTNYVAVYQGDTLIARTDLFSVMGKLGGPLVADTDDLDLGSVAVGESASSRVTLSNQGLEDLAIGSVSFAGANAGDLDVVSSTCGPLTPGASCTVDVRFSPTAVGPRTARLVVRHDGLNDPFEVRLHGVGAAPLTAALSTDPTALAFVPLHTGGRSASWQVTVSNAGGARPLELGAPEVTGGDSASFVVTGSTCAVVPVGGTCVVSVAFAPTAAGAAHSTLRLTATVPSVPASVDIPLTGTATNAAASISPVIRASDGFPAAVTDDNGVRLQPCLDPADSRCVVLADAGFDPARPLVFPTNYPSEWFYTLADSEPISLTECGNSATIFLRVAAEGAFVDGSPLVGDQMLFGRVRLVDRGALCPSTAYTFRTPYGDLVRTTRADGTIDPKQDTVDVGCGAAPCAFGDALPADVFRGFLRWDPAFGPAPSGYLGDAVSYHRVVGGTFLVAGEPVNHFAIWSGGVERGRADRFLVSGHLASGLVGGSADAGEVDLGASRTADVVFTNVGAEPVSPTSVRLSGPFAGQFVVDNDGCTGAAVAADATCTVRVRYAPTLAGDASVTVELLDGAVVVGSGSVHGRGTIPAVPRAVVAPTSVAFPTQRVGTTSAPTLVQVTNTGTATLHVTGAVPTGTGAGSFAAVPAAACAAVAPGTSCSVAVSFAPTLDGARAATLEVRSDDPLGAARVALSGTGTSSLLVLKNTSVDMGKQRVGRSVTKTVEISNGGTATLSIIAVRVGDLANYTVALGTCAPVLAPGAKCAVSITFAPTSLGVKNTTVTFTSDSRVNPVLTVTGAGN